MLSLTDEFRATLLEQYKTAPIDIASFYKNYKVCSMADCLGMCCNGGSGFYMKGESETIARLVREHGDFFKAQGLDVSGKIFDEELDEETGEIELSTNTREESYPQGLKPAHFPDTTCVFKRKDGACTLQVLSIEQGQQGWWYKPLACWLFPIELEHSGKPFIHVAHASTDEYVDETYPGFVGYTKCGAECMSGGKPAYQVLEYEIAALSQLIGRDLMQEILAHEKTA